MEQLRIASAAAAAGGACAEARNASTAALEAAQPIAAADVSSPSNEARDDDASESATHTSSESTHSEPSSSPTSQNQSHNNSKKRPSGSQATIPADDNSKPARRKPRSQWYALQKEEKALLLKEAKYLEARLDFLAALPQNATAARALERLERENRLLRDAMKSQQFDLASAQSALTSQSMKQQSPFERNIHLGREPSARHAALVALNGEMLRDAERYLRERSRFLDVTQKYSSMEKSTTANGDFVIQVFEMMPLQGVPSVRLVYDALRFFFFNMDISLTESSGELVVREGKDELAEQNVCQQRLLRSASCGVQIETNCAMLGSYSAADNENGFGREYAVVTMDFVNDDELYPYKPHERLRHDVSAAITLRTFPRKVSTVGDGEEFEIVLCRSYFSKLHHSEELIVPSEVFDSIVLDADMCSREILRTVYDLVHRMSQSSEPEQAALLT